jgi:hypothetical protein
MVYCNFIEIECINAGFEFTSAAYFLMFFRLNGGCKMKEAACGAALVVPWFAPSVALVASVAGSVPHAGPPCWAAWAAMAGS